MHFYKHLTSQTFITLDCAVYPDYPDARPDRVEGEFACFKKRGWRLRQG